MIEDQENQDALADERGPKLWGWHTVLSIAITLGVFVALAAYVDIKLVWKEVAASNKLLLLLAAVSHYATYPVRGARWRKSLKQVDLKCGNGRFSLLTFFYLFVDNVVPAKLGDVYAAHLARINCGVRRTVALGSIVFLRMIDSWVVLVFAAAASWGLFSGAFPRTVSWSLIGALVIAVAATVIVAFFLLLKRSMPAWIPEFVRHRVSAFQVGMVPSTSEIMRILFLSMVIWALEVLWIYLLVAAFNVHVGFMEAVFLCMIPLIATAFPFTPSGAGAVELTLFSCLRLVNVASPVAVSLTVVNRFLDFWLHIILGTLLWMFRKKFGLYSWKDRAVSEREKILVTD